jgi:Cysteine-rich CWC
MCKHEDKHCPRCNRLFECKAGTITQCQCSAIQLTLEERVYMESKFEDCLCINCLAALQKEYILFKEKHIYK